MTRERRRRVLVISYGEFSGNRRSLIGALRRQGLEIVEVSHSLRFLRFRYAYLALMLANAILVYGSAYRTYLNHTWAAYWARGRANQRAVDQWDDVDAVLSLSPMPNHTRRRKGATYAMFIDHVNLLSKQTPDFGFQAPERGVTSAWNVYERHSLNSQDHVFVPSDYVRRSLVQDYGVDPARAHVVGAGPNLDVDCIRDGVHKDYGGRNVLFVGLDPARKGLPVLLKAFDRVVDAFPDARLDIVGVAGPDTASVHYHGVLVGEPLKNLFYRSQVFAMPSLREPFGIVFLEAMWAKTVCIGTNLFAMPEIIEDGVTGYVVEPQADEVLAERMITLFQDPHRLRRMAEAGYQAACERWSWDLVSRSILRRLFPRAAHSLRGGRDRLYPEKQRKAAQLPESP